jgi:hypothetical protein
MTNQPGQDDPNSVPPEQDAFASFDPETYLRERRAAEGRSYPADDVLRWADEVSGRRRRDRRRREATSLEGEIGDGNTEIPVGLTARIIGALGGGRGSEGIYMWGQILRELTPTIRRFLPIIGCVIVLACLALGTAFYLLVSALSRR